MNNLDFFYLMFDRSEVYGPMQVNFLLLRHIEKTTRKIAKCYLSVNGIITYAEFCFFVFFFVELSEKTGHSSISTLQKFDWQLEPYTCWPHGPVSQKKCGYLFI